MTVNSTAAGTRGLLTRETEVVNFEVDTEITSDNRWTMDVICVVETNRSPVKWKKRL